VRIRDVVPLRDVHESEAEVTGIGRGSALQGDVLVQLVRIGIVRDVEVEAAIVVEVREYRSEAVPDLRTLASRQLGNLTEGRVTVSIRALIQVQQVADGRMVGREAGRSVDDDVRVRVGRDEEIRAPVPVDVADDGRRMPALGVDARLGSALGERAVTVV